MNPHTLVHVEDGGEPYLPYARQRLAALRALRLDLRLPSMRKSYVPASGVRIDLWTTDEEDKIVISASAGGFVVYPKLRRISDDATFAAVHPVLLNFSKTKITEPFNVFSHVGPPYRNSKKRVLASTGSLRGFYDRQKLGGAETVVDTLPFVHSYEVDGSALRKTLGTRAYQNAPVFSDITAPPTGTDLTSSGSAGQVHDVSPDGRKAVGLAGDDRSDFALDFAASPQVARSTTTLSGYGTLLTNRSDFGASNNMDGEPQHTERSEARTATYPVCYGYGADNALVSIGVTESRTLVSNQYLQTLRTITGPGEGYTVSSGSSNHTLSQTHTLTMPNGVSRTFVVAARASAASGSYSNEIHGGNITSFSGSASGTATRTDGELEVLYADASLPAVVYRYVRKVYHFSVASAVSSMLVTVGQDGAATMDVSTTVVALVGDKEHAVYSGEELGIASDIDPAAEFAVADGLGGGAAVCGFYSAILNYTENSSVPVDFTAIFPPKARQQSTDLGVSVKDAPRLLWQYEVGEDDHRIGPGGAASATVLGWLMTAIAADAETPGHTPTEAEVQAYILANFEFLRPTLLGLGFTNEQIDTLFHDAAVAALTTDAVPPQLSDEERAQFLADLALGNMSGYDLTVSSGAANGVGIGLL